MPTIEIAQFVTLENIPLCETGIDYPASTGNISLTREMFAEAIAYSQDPHGLQPRIKIAHGDTPMNDDLQSLFEQYNASLDASVPSLGTILNLRTVNDGHTLVGDWHGLPEWLATVLSTAYPARSIEGGSWTNPANQKTYEFKIDAVALLGVIGPGCTSLADLQELFSKDGPKMTVIEMSAPKLEVSSHKMPVNLQVNVEEIRRAFYTEFAQGDRYWWWDRELLADPWEFIAQDEEGGLWRVPFESGEDSDGDTTVTSWGDPEAIKVKYITDPKRDGVMASRTIAPQLSTAGTLLAVNTTPPPERERKEASAAVAIDITALRERLNLSVEALPDDATEEQINEALTATADEPEASPETPAVEEPASTTEPTVNDDGTVTVDAAAWASMQESVAQLAARNREQERNDREAEVNAAIQDRKIPPARKSHWLSLMEKDPEGTRATIHKLEKNAVPGEEIGTSRGSDDEAGRVVQGTGLIPELQRQEA